MGLWSGHLDAPDQAQPLAIELLIESVASDGELRGSLSVEKDHSPLAGTYDESEQTLSFEADFDDDAVLFVTLQFEGADALRGEAALGSIRAPLQLARSKGPARFFHDARRGQPILLEQFSRRTALGERIVHADEADGAWCFAAYDP